MKKKRVRALLVSAILLACLAGAVAIFEPVVSHVDPERPVASVTRLPAQNFVGDIVEIALDVRFSRLYTSVDPQDVRVDFAPFVLLNQNTEYNDGRLTMRWRLQCLNCVPGATYSFPRMVVVYQMKGEAIRKAISVYVEPIHVSEMIAVDGSNARIRYPNEALAPTQKLLFAGAIIFGFAGIAITMIMARALYGSRKKRTPNSATEENRLPMDPFAVRLWAIQKLLEEEHDIRALLIACTDVMDDALAQSVRANEWTVAAHRLRTSLDRIACSEEEPSEQTAIEAINAVVELIARRESYGGAL